MEKESNMKWVNEQRKALGLAPVKKLRRVKRKKPIVRYLAEVHMEKEHKPRKDIGWY